MVNDRKTHEICKEKSDFNSNMRQLVLFSIAFKHHSEFKKLTHCVRCGQRHNFPYWKPNTLNIFS